MFNIFKYDFFGHAIGNAARRRLEAEVKAGSGPVLAAVLPLLTPVINQQLNKASGAITNALGPSLGGLAVSELEQKLGGSPE